MGPPLLLAEDSLMPDDLEVALTPAEQKRGAAAMDKLRVSAKADTPPHHTF
jgi:hypothetical protein